MRSRPTTTTSIAPCLAAVLAVVALLALEFVPEVAAQSERQPWQLPDDGRRHRDAYWYDRYISAASILDRQGREGDPAQLDEAIVLLQLAISQRPRSARAEIHPTERREFSYVPYFLLAEAYYRKGNLEAARLCLREAETQDVVARSDQAADYQRLRGEFVRLAELERLEETTRVLQTWQQGGPDGCVSEPSRVVAAAALRETQALTDQKRPHEEIRDRLIRGVTEVVRAEGARIKTRLDALDSAPWAAAIEGAGYRIPQGVCDLGALTVDVAQIDAVQQKLTRCCSAATEGLRTAAQRACGELEARRGRVIAQLEAERTLGGAATAAPAPIPDACSRTAWNDLDAGAAAALLDRIAYPENLRRLDDALVAVNERLAEKQEGLRGELAAARDAILTADRACAMELRLGEANTRLAALDASIDRALDSRDPTAAAELGSIGSQIAEARGALVTRAVDGAAGLAAMREQFEGIDAASFSSLPDAADAFRRDPSQAALDKLCQSAVVARQAIQSWGERNIPMFERQVETTRWFLEVAARWPQSGPAEDRLACIEPSLQALPAAHSGGSAGEWVSRAGTAISQARECLADYRERHDRWVADIRRDVVQMAEAAERLAQASDLPKIAEMRTSLGATREALDRLSDLIELPDPLTDEALRRSLDGSGLAAPDAIVSRLDGLSGGDAVEGRAIVRDDALRPTLIAAVASTDAWRPLVSRLGPYLALDQALEAYNRGDLDAAIRALRGGDQGGQALGRPAAMMHATLSFLLYNKLQLLGSAGDERVRALLLDDAQSQAVAALGTEPGFRLPEFLAQGTRFEEFFESCRSM